MGRRDEAEDGDITWGPDRMGMAMKYRLLHGLHTKERYEEHFKKLLNKMVPNARIQSTPTKVTKANTPSSIPKVMRALPAERIQNEHVARNLFDWEYPAGYGDRNKPGGTKLVMPSLKASYQAGNPEPTFDDYNWRGDTPEPRRVQRFVWIPYENSRIGKELIKATEGLSSQKKMLKLYNMGINFPTYKRNKLSVSKPFKKIKK